MVTEVKAKVKPFREIVGNNRLVLNFHEGQTRAWNSKARFPTILAGTQSGKTCFLPHWLHREIQECGPGDYIVATSTFPLLDKKLLPEFRFVFESLFNLGTYAEKRNMFTFYRKADAAPHEPLTRVIFATANAPDSIESATAKAACLDEAGQDSFKRQSWEAILRRLSISEGRALLSSTIYNLGWLKQEVYDRWKAGDKNFDVIQFDSITNPLFPVEEYERAKKIVADMEIQDDVSRAVR